MQPSSDPVLERMGSSVAPPRITEDEAIRIAKDHYGLTVTASRVASERDANFHLTDIDGREFVLKFANPSEDLAVTRFQTEALIYLAHIAPTLAVPKMVIPKTGPAIFSYRSHEGQVLHVRMLSWLGGTPMAHVTLDASLRLDLGRMLGQLSQALSGFQSAEPDQKLIWDLRNALDLRDLLWAVRDPELVGFITERLDDFQTRLGPKLASLRQQAIHNDANPHNVLVDAAQPDRISGILDFGDMVRSAIVVDLVVAGSYLITPDEDVGQTLADLVQGFAQTVPLLPDEIAALPDLIVMRMITSLVVSSWRAECHPENAAYLTRNMARVRAGLDALRAEGNAALVHAIQTRLRESQA